MFIRCAFFRGRVRPGHEAAFTRYVEERLVPLWRRFPGAQEVRVLRQLESDQDHSRYEMVLEIRYPSREAIEAALASPVRAESREVTRGLLEMFDGDVFHTVFAAESWPPLGHPLQP
jgi:antibiotic biosynthesis monooxygenase (ABM) superfamily enzyme